MDASVAAKWVFPENDSDRAVRLLERYESGSLLLMAPELFVSEVANLAWKKAVLRREVELADAVEALRLILAACPELFPTLQLVSRAFDLASLHRRPIYDCLYVALALEHSSPLITADRALVKAFEPGLGSVQLLADTDTEAL